MRAEQGSFFSFPPSVQMLILAVANHNTPTEIEVALRDLRDANALLLCRLERKGRSQPQHKGTRAGNDIYSGLPRCNGWM